MPLVAVIKLFQLTEVFSRLVGNTHRIYKIFESCNQANKKESKKVVIDSPNDKRLKQNNNNYKGYTLVNNPDEVKLTQVTSVTPNGKILTKNLNLTVNSETGSLMIMGPSGCGKVTAILLSFLFSSSFFTSFLFAANRVRY